MPSRESAPNIDTSLSLKFATDELPIGEPLNDHTDQIEISPREREVGKSTYELFTKKLARPLPWTVRGDDILVPPGKAKILQRKYGNKLEYRENNTYSNDGWVVISDGLEHEEISPLLVRVINEFKFTEDYLEDFIHASYMFRNYLGIAKGYAQWGREELNHSLAAGVELRNTRNKTHNEIIEESFKTLEHTWETPFKTPRKVALYTPFQERQTGLSYDACGDQAAKEGAWTVAAINSDLIRPDEIYHGGGFVDYVQAFYREDPEGTTKDAIEVALNYRMPVLNLHPNPLQAFKDVMRLGIQSSDFVAEQVIKPVLLSFGFIDATVAHRVAKAYAEGKRNVKRLS